MRTLFDQYHQPENQLTHALVCCLAEDERLLRHFVQWITGSSQKGRKLKIVEQTLPGEEELTEEEAERRGLPDIWIHDDESWALVIECKIQSSINLDQLVRHRRMAVKRGFEQISLLVLSPEDPVRRLPEYAVHRRWSEVYAWIAKNCDRSTWAPRLSQYMEVAEERMTSSGYMKNGTLTTFTGFHFSPETPYTYREGKRLLRLAMDELRKDKGLQTLGMDPTGESRPAITGSQGSSVWDFLRLRQAKGANFTNFPHLTLAVRQEGLLVIVTVPNGIKPLFRQRLVRLREDGFCDMIHEVAIRLSKLLAKAEGSKPWFEAVQRHFPSQRSAGIVDARIAFDLNTAFPDLRKRRNSSVRPQPEWLAASFRALAKKKSNLQLGIGAMFPYSCPVVKTAAAVDYIAGTWLACEPLISTLLNEAPRPEGVVSGGPPKGAVVFIEAPVGGGHIGKAPLGPG